MIFQLVGVDHHVQRHPQRLVQQHLAALHRAVDLLLFNQADQLKVKTSSLGTVAVVRTGTEGMSAKAVGAW